MTGSKPSHLELHDTGDGVSWNVNMYGVVFLEIPKSSHVTTSSA
jgi:hypothetical protein